MGCSTYLGLGGQYQPLAPGHPTSICNIGMNNVLNHGLIKLDFTEKQPCVSALTMNPLIQSGIKFPQSQSMFDC